MLFRNRFRCRPLVARTLGLSMICGVAGLMGLAAAPIAQAVDEPGPIQMTVQQCLEQISTVGERTRERIENRAQFAVQRIGQLDANDAPVPAMINAAQEGREAVDAIASEGAQRINHIAARCVHHLNHLGAPEGAAQVVLQARQGALHAIGVKQRHAKRAIGEALRSALEDEDLPGGD